MNINIFKDFFKPPHVAFFSSKNKIVVLSLNLIYDQSVLPIMLKKSVKPLAEEIKYIALVPT